MHQQQMEFRKVPIDRLHKAPEQPRTRFSAEAMAELCRSIEAEGLDQPLSVRPDPKRKGHYFVQSGERRLTCLQQLGWKDVPVVVKQDAGGSGKKGMAKAKLRAVMNNISHEDLDPMDQARAFKGLLDSGEYTQAELADRVGCSTSHISTTMSLLDLPASLQSEIAEGGENFTASAGHVLVRRCRGRSEMLEMVRDFRGGNSKKVTATALDRFLDRRLGDQKAEKARVADRQVAEAKVDEGLFTSLAKPLSELARISQKILATQDGRDNKKKRRQVDLYQAMWEATPMAQRRKLRANIITARKALSVLETPWLHL